jgi:TIGR03009 family protein
MWKTCLGLVALAVLLSAGRAQSPQPATGVPAAPGVEPGPSTLDGYLAHWEEAMKKISTLAVACSRTEVDKVYQTRKVYSGTIHFSKPSYFFWHMALKDKPQEYERFVCTGQNIYRYVPAKKEIEIFPAPKTTADGRLAEDSSLAFLFGMKAGEAKQRYELKLHNVDAHYIYVDVTPKNKVDQADFVKARLILNKDSYLPRQIWFMQPNNSEVLWDIPNMQSGVKIKQEVFAIPGLPKDWRYVRGESGPATTGPRVVREQKKE